MNREKLIADLTRDEDLRLVVYDDATGKPLKKGDVCIGHPTIGIGRALDVRGITPAEALYLVNNDIDSAQLEMNRNLPWFIALDEVRQRVLINMDFNIGVGGILGFHDALRHIGNKEYGPAADAMQASAWFGQVKDRGKRLVAMMRTGMDSAAH